MQGDMSSTMRIAPANPSIRRVVASTLVLVALCGSALGSAGASADAGWSEGDPPRRTVRGGRVQTRMSQERVDRSAAAPQGRVSVHDVDRVVRVVVGPSDPGNLGKGGGDDLWSPDDYRAIEFEWSHLEPSADSRMIYVSASRGNDDNPGTHAEPVRSIRRALQLVQNGRPDWILLRRGDTFAESVTFNRNGRTQEEPMVLATYGDGPRPIVAPGDGDEGLAITAAERNHVAIVGIHFKAPDAGTTFDGIRIINDVGRNILIEDCVVEGFRNGMNIQRGSDVRVRGNVVIDTAAPFGGHAQGLYAMGVDDLLVEGNVFDHNGWRDDGLADPTIFNHNVYLRGSDSDPLRRPVVRGNIFSRASSFGCTASSDQAGGVIEPVIERNLFLGNGNGFVHGAGASGAIVQTTVRENVFMRMGREINGSRQAFGLLLEGCDGGQVERNYFVDTDFDGTTFALKIQSDHRRSQRGLNVCDNLSYGWVGGDIKILAGALEDVSITGNCIYAGAGESWRLVSVEGFSPQRVDFEGNAYWADRDDELWFQVDGQAVDAQGWEQRVREQDMQVAPGEPYLEPGRTIETFMTLLGHEASVEAFLAGARAQGRDNWHGEFTAEAVVHYIGEGFTPGGGAAH